MATLTIRNLPEETRRALKERAAKNDRSMEAEVRDILQGAVVSAPADNAGRIWLTAADEIRALGGIELDLPARDTASPVELD